MGLRFSAHRRQEGDRDESEHGRRDGDPADGKPPAAVLADRGRERHAEHEAERAAGVDERDGPAGQARRHDPGGVGGRDREEQSVRDAADDAAGADDGERRGEGDQQVRDRIADERRDEHGSPGKARGRHGERQCEQRDGERVDGDNEAHLRHGDAEVGTHRAEEADGHELGGDGEEGREAEDGDADDGLRGQGVGLVGDGPDGAGSGGHASD